MELVLILIIVLIIFGAGKIPQLGEGLGKAIKGFKKSVNEADAIDVTRLYALGSDAPMEQVFADEVGDAFTVHANGQECLTNGAPRVSTAPAGRMIAEGSFECPHGALAGSAVASSVATTNREDRNFILGSVLLAFVNAG